MRGRARPGFSSGPGERDRDRRLRFRADRFDGASTVEQAGSGTLLVAGIVDGVELSRDGGRTWSRPAVIDDNDEVQGGGQVTADLYTDSDGYVIARSDLLWITRNAGRTWTQVTVR